MNRHHIIRESQFSLSGPEEIRRIGVNPKAVRITIVLESGGPVYVDLQGNDSDKHHEISMLHTMHDFETGPAARVHHIALRPADTAPAHGSIIVWGCIPQESQKG